MLNSLRFRLPALFLAGIALSGLVASLIALTLFQDYTRKESLEELRREARGLAALYAESAVRASDEEKAAMKYIDKIISRARSRGIDAKPLVLVSAPSVSEKIVSFAARKNFDLIVIGTRGLGSFKRLLIGSISSGVLSHAPCSVLVVR